LEPVIRRDEVRAFPRIVWRGDLAHELPGSPARTEAVRHRITPPGQKHLHFEFNVLNVFNQQTARHIFNYVNKGAIIPDRQSSSIDLLDGNPSEGYDYIALINSTSDGEAQAYDPRYAPGDLSSRVAERYATVTFVF
jgi:hypothetical protein